VESAELRALVATLPERQRLVLFLRYYADLDYQAIGGVLGIATGTVSATLNQAHGARPEGRSSSMASAAATRSVSA